MNTITKSSSIPQLVRRITEAKAKEDRRRLAVQRVLEGETQVAVAASLKVSDRSVRNWMSWYRNQGEDGLQLRPHPGGESKMTDGQADQVRDCSRRTRRNLAFTTTSGPRRASANSSAKHSPSPTTPTTSVAGSTRTGSPYKNPRNAPRNAMNPASPPGRKPSGPRS